MDNVAKVTGAYEAFGRGDIASVLAVLADDVEWSSPLTLPHGGQFIGKAGVGEFFQGMGASWAGLRLEIHGVSALTADTVVGVVRANGELRSGGPAGYGAAHVFTFADGNVVGFHEYVDLDKPLT